MAMRTKTRNFNPRAPCGARPTGTKQAKDLFEISTHAPLAGRDSRSWSNASLLAGFQPTRPLRGATVFGAVVLRMLIHFNPRAPCGARPVTKINVVTEITFQPTRPLRGATSLWNIVPREAKFQPTRPLRGATLVFITTVTWIKFQPTRPLRGATNEDKQNTKNSKFQPTRPLRGATIIYHPHPKDHGISTHAPLAGRDR